MKLRNLNGAVRKAGDKITVKVTAPDGRPIIFRIARSDTVKGLTEAFGDGSLETGLMIDADGALVRDMGVMIETPNGSAVVSENMTLPDGFEDGDEDLLGEAEASRNDANAPEDEDLLAEAADEDLLNARADAKAVEAYLETPASSVEDDDGIEDLLA